MINGLITFLRNWLWFLKLHPHASAHVDCSCGNESVSSSSDDVPKEPKTWLEKHRSRRESKDRKT